MSLGTRLTKIRENVREAGVGAITYDGDIHLVFPQSTLRRLTGFSFLRHDLEEISVRLNAARIVVLPLPGDFPTDDDMSMLPGAGAGIARGKGQPSVEPWREWTLSLKAMSVRSWKKVVPTHSHGPVGTRTRSAGSSAHHGKSSRDGDHTCKAGTRRPRHVIYMYHSQSRASVDARMYRRTARRNDTCPLERCTVRPADIATEPARQDGVPLFDVDNGPMTNERLYHPAPGLPDPTARPRRAYERSSSVCLTCHCSYP